ncbi:MAG: DUF1963 domain-containing protein [Muribaculaceae bacterium]|nr:DUF1963 domain-containing protein [Muribaculaceae bacterium]
MRKSGILLPAIALICFTIIGGVALRILVTDWETESRTRIIMLIAVVLLMTHGWYRALVHIRPRTSVDEVEDEVEQASSVKAVIGAFFNPMKMRFRTSLSIFILVLTYLFATPFMFWALLVLLIALKGYMLYQLIRYHKAVKELARLSAEQTADEVEFDEEKVKHYMELLKSFGRDAIQISFAQDGNAPLPIGCSKYGGRPDVPADFQWPHDNSGRPLSLLLQINCADLAPHDREGILPTSGHLYFFYELSQMDWDGTENDVRVIYNDLPLSQLHPLDFPENLADEYQLKEWPLQFTHGTSIPTIEELSQLTDEPFNEDDEDERYETFDRLWNESLIGSGDIGSMLGYAYLIQGSIVDDLTNEVLLLQLDSNGEYWREDDKTPHDLLFGDDGCIYFYIKREDLLARRFDNIKFALQCY